MPEPVSHDHETETVSPQSQEVSKPWELEGVSRATWFRHRAANNKNNIPATEIPIQEMTPASEPQAVEAIDKIEPQPEPEINPATQAEINALNADEAANALRLQIAALRQAEALQAQHQAAMMAQQAAMQVPVPTTREEKLEAWRQAGMSKAEEQFLIERPEMIDHDKILTAAIGTAARAGIDRNAPEFLPAVQKYFDTHLRHFQQQARANSPQFFRPPPIREPSVSTPPSIVSAPVSRDAPGGERQSPLPTKITLTAEEKDAARFSGITERQYAENKLKMMAAKMRGEIMKTAWHLIFRGDKNLSGLSCQCRAGPALTPGPFRRPQDLLFLRGFKHQTTTDRRNTAQRRTVSQTAQDHSPFGLCAGISGRVNRDYGPAPQHGRSLFQRASFLPPLPRKRCA
jgi:hypothetical protein